MTARPRRNDALRVQWFDAANEILATDGYGGLKLAPLCKRLGVTTGSFYHSFESWQDFTDALLAAWVNDRTARTVAIVREHEDPVTRLLMLAQAGAELLHRSEAAIRVWAGIDPRVAQIQHEVDQARYEVVHEAMLQLVGAERAEQFTVWGVSTLVGYEMLAAEHRSEHLGWSLQQILELARAQP